MTAHCASEYMNGRDAPDTEQPARTLEAWLFDLDGVITDTAGVHAEAWKSTFDAFLRARAEAGGAAFEPFTMEDYLRHVDGRPRRDGVRAFLASRGIELPEGDDGDTLADGTVSGIAGEKTAAFLRRIREQGVSVFPGSVELVRRVRERGAATAVVTASRNCGLLLDAAEIADLFDTRVAGNDAARDGLAGKPAPDTFLEAARRLGVEPSRAAVVEDAVAGVQAARAGGFALVIGVDRGGNAGALAGSGADVVVSDLSQLLERLDMVS